MSGHNNKYQVYLLFRVPAVFVLDLLAIERLALTAARYPAGLTDGNRLKIQLFKFKPGPGIVGVG